MEFRRTSLILCILFIFHLQQNFPFVSSRSSPIDANHKNETLPLNASTPDVVGFEGKSRELAVVIRKGGRGGGGGSRGGSRSRSRGGVVPVHTGSGTGSHRSSGSRILGGTARAVGWLTLSVLAGFYLVQ